MSALAKQQLESIRNRGKLLTKNLGRKGVGRIVKDWFSVRGKFDRHEIAGFIKNVLETHGFDREEIAKVVRWDKSSVSKAQSHGAISGEKYHRLIVEFSDEFKPSLACEGCAAAYMWTLTWVGRHDRSVRKRRMSREVFEWVRLIAEMKDLQLALLDPGSYDLNQEVSEAQEVVASRLQNAVVHSVTQKTTRKGGIDLEFHPRRSNHRNRIANGKDVIEIMKEWLPSIQLINVLEPLKKASYAAE